MPTDIKLQLNTKQVENSQAESIQSPPLEISEISLDDDSVIVNEDVQEQQGGTLWNALLSSGGRSLSSDGQNSAVNWNINEMFKIGFNINGFDNGRLSRTGSNQLLDQTSLQNSTHDLSLLDEDTRKLLSQHQTHDGSEMDLDQITDEMYKFRMKELLRRLLDLPMPRITDQMMDFLLTDGVVECLLSFIVRIQQYSSTEWSYGLFQDLDQLQKVCGKLRERIDVGPQRYSYNVIELLCIPNPLNVRLLDIKFNEIISTIFDIFDQESDGNFHHFAKFMDYIILRNSNRLLDFLMFNNSFSDMNLDSLDCQMSFPLIMRMIPHIGNSQVEDILIKLLFKSFGNIHEDPSCITRHTRRFESVSQSGFNYAMWDIILLSANSDSARLLRLASDIADFIVQTVDIGRDVEGAIMLFIKFCESPDVVISRIVQVLSQLISLQEKNSQLQLSIEQRIQKANIIIKALHAYSIKSSVKRFRPLGIPANDTSIEDECSALSDLANVTNKCLSSHLHHLSLIIIGYLDLCETNSSQSTLSSHFIFLMQVFLEAFRIALSDDTFNEKDISLDFWEKLDNLFWNKPNNTLYLNIYSSIMIQIVRQQSLKLQEDLIIKSQFLDKCIENFKLNKENRGHIILILNTIRLQCEFDPECYLARSFAKLKEWIAFWPKLKLCTEHQIKVQSNSQSPIQNILPNLSIELDCKSTRNDFLFKTLDRNGIHVGSVYAALLGFIKHASSDPKSPEHEFTLETSNQKSLP